MAKGGELSEGRVPSLLTYHLWTNYKRLPDAISRIWVKFRRAHTRDGFTEAFTGSH